MSAGQNVRIQGIRIKRSILEQTDRQTDMSIFQLRQSMIGYRNNKFYRLPEVIMNQGGECTMRGKKGVVVSKAKPAYSRPSKQNADGSLVNFLCSG